ncbi:hypothetical protein HPB50_020102 [Hyalomma asiaticum]|uniref:Uncharacterized protein n=1 Tax=Hyalomma asiaticum TaxID=266040 RepID=A0ACB7RM10_HYAAI|nr:hypothetical protein HPB50_020102 [Hyalomma asiaticum]
MWELNAYERQRTPHEIIDDDAVLPLHEESFYRDLRCPICFDLLRSAVTPTDCLHRFCEECITTALRKCNKECPICRTKVTSRRSLRRDHRIDNLIAMLAPNAAQEEYERPSNNVLSDCVTSRPRQDFERGVEKQACKPTIVRLTTVNRTEDGRDIDGSPIPTLSLSGTAPVTDDADCQEVEVDVVTISPWTSPQRSSTDEQPYQERSESEEDTDADSVARAGPSGCLSLRRSYSPTDDSSVVSADDFETDESDEDPLLEPAIAVAGAGCSGLQEDTTEEDSSSTSAGVPDIGKILLFRDALLRNRRILVAMTLKPHPSMTAEDPGYPTFYISLPGRASIRHVSMYLRRRLFPDSMEQQEQRCPEYCIYVRSVTGGLVQLSEDISVMDAIGALRKSGELPEVFYALEMY